MLTVLPSTRSCDRSWVDASRDTLPALIENEDAPRAFSCILHVDFHLNDTTTSEFIVFAHAYVDIITWAPRTGSSDTTPLRFKIIDGALPDFILADFERKHQLFKRINAKGTNRCNIKRHWPSGRQ